MKKLSDFYKAVLKFLWVPTVLANLISALTMDEKGFSLKKLGFCFAIYEASKMSHEVIASPNFTMATGITIIGYWLIFAGILVGIYSFKDIVEGIAKVRGAGPGANGEVKIDTPITDTTVPPVNTEVK